MTYQNLTFEMDENVAIVALDRDERLNSLSVDLLSELRSAVDDAVLQNAKSILITGKGRAFCAGADLSGGGMVEGDAGKTLEARYHPLFRRLHALEIPLVSAINGPAVGAGAALAMAADISIIARSAYLQFGFVAIGLVPDSGASWLLARSVGRTRALELTLLGERIEAERAVSLGLVTRLAEDAACFEEALAVARRLAAGPVPAMGLIRRQMSAALDADHEGVLAIEAANQSAAAASADFLEGVAAFREKRPPHFGEKA